MAELQGGMSTIVQVVTRWILLLTLVFGLGVAFFGHLTPGGGFAGGVVLACGAVMATLAFGSRTGPVSRVRRAASSIDAVGALAFLGIGVLGFTAGHFLERWITLGDELTLTSTRFVVLLNVAVLLKVGAGLFAGFAAIVAFARSPTDTDADADADADGASGKEDRAR